MSSRPNNLLLHAWLAVLLCVAGCSTLPDTADIPSARDAQAEVTIGKSTKADVATALGKALVINFDSGYEVWVYRERGAGQLRFAQPASAKPELVLLFEPTGVLKKSRIRMP